MLENVCSILRISDIKDFEKAEIILHEADAKEYIDEVAQEIAEKIIIQNGWIVNPVEIALKKVVQLSDYPECFEINYTLGDFSVDCNLEKLKENMKKDNITFKDLNKQTIYLIEKTSNHQTKN